jgi:NitT/TauT family transport system substrate-binding protein
MTSKVTRLRSVTAALLAGLLITTAAACGSDEPTTPSTPGVPDNVTVGVIPIIDVAPIYLGLEKGFFTNRNINLTLTLAQGGAAIVPAVVSGQYQFGFSNVISLLVSQQNLGPVLKVVSNGNNSTGDPSADFGGVVVKADSTIASPKDLAGKKVATNTLKNIVDTSVKELVRKDGGDPGAVSFVELPFPNMGAALAANQVDAIFVVEPFYSADKAQGFKSIATWADVAPNLCVALYFTSAKLATENPDLVLRFTEAMKESLAFADANPNEARRIIGTYTQITDQVRAAITLPKWPAEINEASINTLAGLAVTDGLLTGQPDLNILLP